MANKLILGSVGLILVIGLWSFLSKSVAYWRYRSARQDMQHIAEAAERYHGAQGDWPEDVNPGLLPPELSQDLKEWPQPPCEGWSYDWEDWIGVPLADDTVRITLRSKALTPMFYFCISSSKDCAPPSVASGGTDISKLARKRLTCKEKGS
jgi:hypothetical protein